MIVVIRIAGKVGIERAKARTLETLGLKKKYSCVLIPEDEVPRLNTVKDKVTFGKIDEETLNELLLKRAKKDIKNEKELAEIKKSEKFCKEIGTMALHPPRRGFRKSTKLVFPAGILGNNPKINELIKRML